MKEVTAFEDSNGHLHKRLKEAVESDFIDLVRRAWGSMPDGRERGDPVVIARILASDTYANARLELRDAITWFESQSSKD